MLEARVASLLTGTNDSGKICPDEEILMSLQRGITRGKKNGFINKKKVNCRRLAGSLRREAHLYLNMFIFKER